MTLELKEKVSHHQRIRVKEMDSNRRTACLPQRWPVVVVEFSWKQTNVYIQCYSPKDVFCGRLRSNKRVECRSFCIKHL